MSWDRTVRVTSRQTEPLPGISWTERLAPTGCLQISPNTNSLLFVVFADKGVIKLPVSLLSVLLLFSGRPVACA